MQSFAHGALLWNLHVSSGYICSDNLSDPQYGQGCENVLVLVVRAGTLYVLYPKITRPELS